MMNLEKGKFYSNPGGRIYYYDGTFLRIPGTPRGLDPTTTPHNGLASVHHQDQVYIREFQETDPLEYLARDKRLLNELEKFVKEYTKESKLEE